MQRSNYEGHRWHSFRRCGAALLWVHGTRVPTLLMAGGGGVDHPVVARLYC